MVDIRGITLYLGILMLAATNLVESLKPPSFVSSWSYIETDTFNNVNITHNMNSLPAKVEVQIKAIDGPNKSFIFPGTSATQNDDDDLVIRGGAIYMYNENDILIFSGIGTDARIIYTGSSENRIGPNVQSSISGQARARVWSACDFPKPDFSSDWFEIATHDGNFMTSNPPFKEINHNLGVHPAYVSVQVQILEGVFAGYYFDGIGRFNSAMDIVLFEVSKFNYSDTRTCMVDSSSQYLNNAGVLYAYNETTVRMWMPKNKLGCLFGLIDGWGTFLRGKAKQGKARVLAWKTIGETVMETSTAYGDGVANEDYEIAVKRNEISKEVLIIVEVEAKDGDNKDFRFTGTGAAMEDPNNDGNYGGIIYSFNETSVRIWIPSDTNNQGFIAFVGGKWGGFYSQASNAVDIVFKVWELHEQDQGPCANNACLLTPSGYSCSCCSFSPEFCSDLFREIQMNIICLNQRPPDNVSIQKFTTSSPVQCSNDLSFFYTS
ncbi:hypothetical protein KUTeg_010407 [Tegillarca granosa]|uniref:Uncharacterized protein n=1 Tax=Tegillarca granosa TaxID=220873 RepID=A0ABQ9F6U2_TEGGR|nr:hypothetical protein KUTeg_010407 [Tegillarca granosa]